MEIKNTSSNKGFDIFNKVSEEKFDAVNENTLRMFMLDTNNKLFNYEGMYQYIMENIPNYVFDRKKVNSANGDNHKIGFLYLESLDHFRPINSEEDKGAGGELGEILLYLFLEQDLHAPKLFSKVELKTSSKDYIKGSDGLHFKFRDKTDGTKVMQIVVGEAKIQNELKNGIQSAFESIDAYISNNTQDRILLDTHLLEQYVDEEEASILKEYILGYSKKPLETIFGIFIGYSIDYQGETDSNDEYEEKVIEENIKQVLNMKEKIIDYIKKYKISNYQFEFYFLPFHNAQRDRKVIMKSLASKKSKLEWGEIRNG